VRENEAMELSLNSEIFNLPDGKINIASYVKSHDADNDQISFVQVYDSSKDSPGMQLDGERFPVNSTYTISAEQWGRLKVDSSASNHYYFRVTDGSSWSDWLTVKFDAS